MEAAEGLVVVVDGLMGEGAGIDCLAGGALPALAPAGVSLAWDARGGLAGGGGDRARAGAAEGAAFPPGEGILLGFGVVLLEETGGGGPGRPGAPFEAVGGGGAEACAAMLALWWVSMAVSSALKVSSCERVSSGKGEKEDRDKHNMITTYMSKDAWHCNQAQL